MKTLFRPSESSGSDKVDGADQRPQTRYKPRDSSHSDEVDGDDQRPRTQTLYKPRFRPQSSGSDKVDGDDRASEMKARRTATLKRSFSSQISEKTVTRMKKVLQV